MNFCRSFGKVSVFSVFSPQFLAEIPLFFGFWFAELLFSAKIEKMFCSQKGCRKGESL